MIEETLDILAKECTRYEECLCYVRRLAEKILCSNKPACVNDKECPVNGSVGFDSYCDLTCPFVLAKKIVDKIIEVT